MLTLPYSPVRHSAPGMVPCQYLPTALPSRSTLAARSSPLQRAARSFHSSPRVRERRNLLIYGPSGGGKSHLAQALGHEACRQGYDVLYVNAHKMLVHLNGGRADGSVERRLVNYVRPDLLILDDFGLKPLTGAMAEELYAVIAERYERGSILLTSNRSPNEWPELFGSPLRASAGLDRLAHRAEMLVIHGNSYRTQGRLRFEQEVAQAER